MISKSWQRFSRKHPSSKRARHGGRQRRRLVSENLETRTLLAADVVSDAFVRMDVNQDGYVAPLDALMVINHVGTHEQSYDVNVDGVVSPLDVLNIVDTMNAPGFDSQVAAKTDSGLGTNSAAFMNDDHVNEIGPDASPIEDGNIGTLETEGDVDVFRFVAGEGAMSADVLVLPLALSSASVSVLDADGGVIAEAANAGSFDPIFVTVAIDAPGEYFVAVSAADTVATGNYLVDVTVHEDSDDPDPDPDPDPVDDHVNEIGPDATVVEFGPVTNGQSVGHAVGILEVSGDVDVFQFEVLEDNSFYLHGIVLQQCPLTITLFDADGTALATIEQSDFEPIDFATDLVAGTYYLTVSSDMAVQGDPYFLDLTLGDYIPPEPPADDHVDEIGPDSTVVSLAGGAGFADGLIGDADDIDTFQFSLESDDTVTFSSFPVDVLVTDAQLIDADGNVIADIPGQSIFDPFFTEPLSIDLAAGNYFLSVAAAETQPFGVGTGYYLVEVFVGNGPVDPDPDPDPVDDHVNEIGPDATPLGVLEDGLSVVGVGVLETPDDVDAFQFETTNDVTIRLAGIIPGSTAEYSVLDADGSVIVSGVFADGDVIQADIGPGLHYLTVAGDPALGLAGDFYLFEIAAGDSGNTFDDHSNEIGPEATGIQLVPNVDGRLSGTGIGFFETSDDVDVFQFQLDVDAAIIVDNVWTFSASSRVELVDSTGNVLGSVDGGDFAQATLEVDLTSGLYYLVVSSPLGDIGSHQVNVSTRDAVVEPTDDHADEIGPDATPLQFIVRFDSALVAPGDGTLEVAGDVDVFRFTLSEDTSVDVNGFAFVTGETFLRVTNATTGEVLEANAGLFSPLNLQADLAAGEYYVEVGSTDGIGQYQFEVVTSAPDIDDPDPADDDHADEIGPDATVLPLGPGDYFATLAVGTLELNTDVDVFQFTLEDGAFINALSLPLGFPEVYFEIIDGVGATVAEGGGEDQVFTDLHLPAGDYFLSVSSRSVTTDAQPVPFLLLIDGMYKTGIADTNTGGDDDSGTDPRVRDRQLTLKAIDAVFAD